MNRMGGLRRGTRLAALAGSVAALGASAALAMAPEMRSEGGLLVFANVRIENAIQPIDGHASASAAAQGMRAYRDAETGKLRKPTGEDALDEAQSAPPGNDPATATITTWPNGRRSALLDESFMSYAVVSKGDDGQLAMQCVTGAEQARRALDAHAARERGHAH